MPVVKESWMEEVHAQLIKIYAGTPETQNLEGLTKITIFLDILESDDTDGPIHPHWKSLKRAWELGNLEYFKRLADGLIRTAEERERKDEEYRESFLQIAKRVEEKRSRAGDGHSNFKEYNGAPAPCPGSEGYSSGGYGGVVLGVGTGLAKVFDVLPPPMKLTVVKVIGEMASRYVALSTVNRVTSVVMKVGGTLVMVGLAGIYVTAECWKNMNRWWRGEITGKRCAKGCVDSIVEAGLFVKLAAIVELF